MNSKTVFDIGAVVFGIVSLVILAMIFIQPKPVVKGTIKEAGAEENATEEGVPKKVLKSYIGETIYDGMTELPQELYQYPFGITENYVMNKNYEDSVTDEKYVQFEETATEYVNQVFNISYRDIMANPEEYINGYETLFLENQHPDKSGETMMEWMIDNHISMKGEILTDRSLLYKDIFPTLRGLITFTVYHCDNLSELESMLGICNIKESEKYYLIYDFVFSSLDDVEVKINSIRKIA